MSGWKNSRDRFRDRMGSVAWLLLRRYPVRARGSVVPPPPSAVRIPTSRGEGMSSGSARGRVPCVTALSEGKIIHHQYQYVCKVKSTNIICVIDRTSFGAFACLTVSFHSSWDLASSRICMASGNLYRHPRSPGREYLEQMQAFRGRVEAYASGLRQPALRVLYLPRPGPGHDHTRTSSI